MVTALSISGQRWRLTRWQAADGLEIPEERAGAGRVRDEDCATAAEGNCQPGICPEGTAALSHDQHAV